MRRFSSFARGDDQWANASRAIRFLLNDDRFDSWKRHPAEREGIPYDDATA